MPTLIIGTHSEKAVHAFKSTWWCHLYSTAITMMSSWAYVLLGYTNYPVNYTTSPTSRTVTLALDQLLPTKRNNRVYSNNTWGRTTEPFNSPPTKWGQPSNQAL